jgi:hypothetical protein
MGVQKFKRPILITARANQVEDADDVEVDVLQQSELGGGGGGGVSPTILEKDTGLTWLDGETVIYEKTVEIEVWPVNSSASNPHGITGLDVVVEIFGMVQASTGTWYRVSHAKTIEGVDNTLDVLANTTNLLVRSPANWVSPAALAGWITMRYTKSA